MGKITQKTAQKIIDEYCQGSSTYELGDKYGLWQTSICNLISGRSWKQCKRPENIEELIQSRREKGRFRQGRNDHLHETYPELTGQQKEILLGSLLGDGYLSKIPKNQINSAFLKKQCKKYKKYVEWHVEELSPFSKKIDKIYSNTKPICNEAGIVEHVEVPRYLAGHSVRTCQHPFFTEMRQKWYPNGKKIVPLDIDLTPLSIAIWFCDDGSNNPNNRCAVICTESFSIKEVEFLSDCFSKFDIQPSIWIKNSKKTGSDQPILQFHSESYDKLINLIKPHITWNCMKHKTKWRKAIHQREYSSSFTENHILQIYELSKTRKQYEIANMFNVHKNTISSILRGESWSHLHHLCPYIPKSTRRQITHA